MATYTDKPIEERLVNSATAFLAAAPALAALTILERDEDAPISPPTENPKKLKLIALCTDEGRTVAYAPIRNLRLQLILRGNAKTEAGKAEGMHEAQAALERLLDDSNLKTALDSTALGVRVMLAVRRAGCGYQREGMIRRTFYEIELRAVAAERCG